MSTDADGKKFWDEHAARLRDLARLRPLTPEEAEKAAMETPPAPMSEDELLRLIAAATPCEPEEPCELDPDQEKDLDWLGEVDTEDVSEGVLQLNRNKGEDDEGTAETEEELRRRMLDDEEDEDGMEGGTGPTRPSGRGG